MTDWDEKLDGAEKFREKWCSHAKAVYRRYADERDGAETGRRANIFFSNVNTLKESLYNSPPRPDVSRMHRGEYDDEASRVAALIVSRGLEYEVECAPNFSEAVSSAILDRLVPGLGAVWVSFSAEAVAGQVDPASEQIKVEAVYWDDFLYSPARRWSQVTWVARRLHLTEKEFVSRFGEEMMQAAQTANDKDPNSKELNKDRLCVYEIWDKEAKVVRFVMKGVDAPLKEMDDPYGLREFFPCPRPLIANVTTSKFLPITDYSIAQDQYLQLDAIYARISYLVEAIRVAGVYNSSVAAISRMFESSNNVANLVPVDDWAKIQETGGVDGLISWYPVERVVGTIQALEAEFAQVKNTLYEITGMSDIVRGASNQYETAAAQQIKAQFASVRLNGYQRDVAIFVRDTIRIMAEMMTQLYSDEKLRAVVGQLTPPDEAQVPAAMQILRNDLLAKYDVNIQTNSLTQADWALERGQRIEVVQSLGQMLGQLGPMAAQAPELGMLAVQMVKFAVAGLKGGSELEGWVDSQLDAMVQAQQQQAGQPPQPNPEQMAAMQQAQADQQEAEMKMAKAQQELQFEQQKNALELAKLEQELQFNQQKYQLELAKMMQPEVPSAEA